MVTVNDTEVPTISAPAAVIVSTDAGQCSATNVALGTPTFNDNCPGSTVGNNAPAVFQKGMTTVTWTVTDASGNTATAEQVVTVTNDIPVITSFSATTVDPVALNSPVTMKLEFNDNNAVSALIDWGNSISQTVVATTSPVSVTYTYPATGVYTVNVILTDACGETATATYKYVVIYDPNGGFVTGGGWIMSPVGAYLANTSLTGKATFGFVSKYKKGSNVPEGNTEFQFHAGNLNFKSSSYNAGSLVIAGARAIYKGTGTINGTGSYGFMVFAIDGQVSGGGGFDKFRIKIWDLASGAIVYDNGLDADENVDAATALGGGSIVIHSTAKKAAEINISASASKPELLVYPNPFSDRLRFEFNSPTDSHARIDLYDIAGKLAKTIFDAPIRSNESYNAEFVPEGQVSGMYLYRMTIGNEVFNGKVTYKK